MTQTSESIDPVLRAAEEAAATGDFETAERLLRELLAAQEKALGAVHPEVANTLNNLAVVCERLHKYDEAERGYRRAHAIAVASLPPKHPFVATSIKNLVDFCKAQGIPIWRPPTATQPVTTQTGAMPQAVAAAVPVSLPPQQTAEPVAAAASPASRGLSWGAAAAAAVAAAVIVALVAMVGWRTSDNAAGGAPGALDTAGAAPGPAPDSETGSDAAPPIVAAAEPSLPPADRPVERVAAAVPEAGAGERHEGDLLRIPAASDNVTVMTAAVCGDFERRGSPDWACTPVAGETGPRLLTFYSRVGAKTATTIEHRWYYEGRLQQTMRLAVPAQGGGYRTFSRKTVSPGRTGEWKVELRTPEGEILKEERFVVR